MDSERYFGCYPIFFNKYISTELLKHQLKGKQKTHLHYFYEPNFISL